MSKIQGFSAVPIERAQSAIDNYKRLHNEANQAFNRIRTKLLNTVTYHWFGLCKSNAFKDLIDQHDRYESRYKIITEARPGDFTKAQSDILEWAGYPRDEKKIYNSLKSLIDTTTEDNVLCNPTLCQFIVDYSDEL